MKKIITYISVFLFIFLFTNISSASNGLNMISYGGQEAGMAGASIGVSDNAMAMNNNPAGLTEIMNGELSFGISLLIPYIKHKDWISPLWINEKLDQGHIFFLPMVAYAKRLSNGPVVFGIGIFTLDGIGVDFRGLNTAFGIQDTIYTNVRYAKITPAVAYQITDKFSVGMTLNIGYSDMEIKFLPNTYFPGSGGSSQFSGMHLRDVFSFGYGAKIGIKYKLNEVIHIGAVYTTKSCFNYDHGKVTFTAPEPYGGTFDASVDGFNLPQSLGIGIGVRPTNKLLIAFDIKWLNWSGAIKTVKIKTSSSTPWMSSLPFEMDWRDQTVIAIGISYKTSEKLTVRAGYNYGNSPVRWGTMPLFPAITEKHATLGFGFQLSNNWNIDVALEHAFNRSSPYYTPKVPLGNMYVQKSVEHDTQNTIHFFTTYKF
jgi:long-chain fatty acid transport protein